MENIKLVIEYDGTNYVGWQIQPDGPSIQGELEKALHQILQEPISTVAAGRTDAGVHARGQVVSFRKSKSIQIPILVRGLNAVLPHDIVILSAQEVSDAFHARYSAKWRVYRYHLSLKPTALFRDFCWYVGGYNINVELLQSCAAALCGEHDFSSFCKKDANTNHFMCTVARSLWRTSDSNIVFEICANRFLYGMVRAIVGTMVEVARGVRPVEEFSEILDAKDRTRAGMSAPAKGLFLEEIIYDS